MPSRPTIIRWLVDEDKTAFRVQYEAAFKVQMLGVFDELKDLMDECEVADIAKVWEQLKLRQWLSKIHESKRLSERPEPVEPPAPDTRDLSLLTPKQYAAYKEAVRIRRFPR